jgi:hypothetical protein
MYHCLGTPNSDYSNIPNYTEVGTDTTNIDAMELTLNNKNAEVEEE